MTSYERLALDLPELLAELGQGPAPEYRDDIVQQTARMRQRPAWMFPERWLPVDLTARRVFVAPGRWRPTVAVVLLAALLVAALVAFAVGSRRALPAPFGPAGNGQIAYAANGDIYLGDPVTGRSRAIATGPETDHDPRFSKTGDRFVFLRQSADRTGENVLIANADGSGVGVLTKTPLTNVTAGDWSADGRTIVLLSSREGRQQMSVVDVLSGQTRPLDLGFDIRSPEVTFMPPNDDEIAFVVSANEHVSTTYAVKPDGSDLRVVISEGTTRFSPDGSKLAYEDHDVFNGQPRIRIHVVALDGGHDLTIENPPNVQYQGNAIWSPDGSRLLVGRAYYAPTGGAVLSLAIVPAGGGPGVDIGPSPDGFGSAGWSPDGTMIVMSSANEALDGSLIRVDDGTYRSVPRWYTASWQRVAP